MGALMLPRSVHHTNEQFEDREVVRAAQSKVSGLSLVSDRKVFLLDPTTSLRLEGEGAPRAPQSRRPPPLQVGQLPQAVGALRPETKKSRPSFVDLGRGD